METRNYLIHARSTMNVVGHDSNRGNSILIQDARISPSIDRYKSTSGL